MDIIFIKSLKVDTVIGIYDWERKIRQDITLDIEMSANITKASQTDAVEQTVDYKVVAKKIIAFVQKSNYQLVETLAEKICELILGEFNINWVKLTLNKGSVLKGAMGVGVIIQRTNGNNTY